jgi:hypothetical protein
MVVTVVHGLEFVIDSGGVMTDNLILKLKGVSLMLVVLDCNQCLIALILIIILVLIELQKQLE